MLRVLLSQLLRAAPGALHARQQLQTQTAFDAAAVVDGFLLGDMLWVVY